MKTENQSFENFNELVFENRNKAYGAYVLRNSYTDNLTKSMVITFAFSATLLCLGVLFSGNSAPKTVPKLDDSPLVETLFNSEIDITPKPKIEKVDEKIVPVKPKTDILNLVATDKKVDTEVKPNDETTIVKNGVIKGIDSTENKHLVDNAPPTIPLDNNTNPKLWAEEMPEFKGNLFKYLKDNLAFPRMAVEAGTQGTVYLSFVVEKDGSIGDIKTLKPVGEGCTEEAIRVVKSMPNWKPGKNHGQEVRVQYNLPVKFSLK